MTFCCFLLTHADLTSCFFVFVPSVSVALDQCKLDYQACISGKKITVKCAGMCPCTSQPEKTSVEKKGTHLDINQYRLSRDGLEGKSYLLINNFSRV